MHCFTDGRDTSPAAAAGCLQALQACLIEAGVGRVASTAHSVNPVPLIVTAGGVELRATGTLADVAPTVLALLGMAPPDAMTGHSLLSTP